MTVEYTEAREVADVAARIIKEHHAELAGERIEYVFRSEAARQGGKTIWGKARKISGLNAFLADGDLDEGAPFFVIEIAKDVWDELGDKQRRALVDHELSHCGLDKDGLPKLLPHDLEEFNAVVRRHGLWRQDVSMFVESAGVQMRLMDDEAE